MGDQLTAYVAIVGTVVLAILAAWLAAKVIAWLVERSDRG